MLELALAGNEQLRPSSMELDRGGVSFTVETLGRIADEQPGAQLVPADGGRFAARPADLARAGADLPAGPAGRRSPRRLAASRT